MNFNRTLKTLDKNHSFYSLMELENITGKTLDRLPFSVRILLEGVLRNLGKEGVSEQNINNLINWSAQSQERPASPFFPGRVLMQDFSGVPVINDLAAMRSAAARAGADPARIQPRIPVDLVIDHSIQVDKYGSPQALKYNAEIEFQRNRERYEFLHWGKQTFDNLRIIPPSTGIIHQVNLEYLTQCVLKKELKGNWIVFPDTVVGTDSHTTMINGLGVLGWGIGGIEAVAAMLEQPLDILIPDVIGVKLSGKLPEGTTPTDLTLTLTQILRERKVVGKFIEYFGAGLDSLSLEDRAMISNMAPENGGTLSFFPVDDQTLEYLRSTSRSEEIISLVETYYKAQGLFRNADTPDPEYTDVIHLDLSTIESSLAGPRRPQDKISLQDMKRAFEDALQTDRESGGFNKPEPASAILELNGETFELGHGAILIAAITSCTNTSNPYVMMAAGLLARKAVEKGLSIKPYVKTSLAPGSIAVSSYLEAAGLQPALSALGYDNVGYGCTSCIGNSGPLLPEVVEAVQKSGLVAAAVLSGNRNFEGRVSPYTLANYLASPPLVIAYALAGTVDIDLKQEPLGMDQEGHPVYLVDIWPNSEEIAELIRETITPELFKESYDNIFERNQTWNAIPSSDSLLFAWEEDSTYLQEPPFFEDFPSSITEEIAISGARVLVKLGDSTTTDHISPAGAIPVESPAGRYLSNAGIEVKDFNSFGSRRGNDRVMTRGTFGNIRLKNQLVPGIDGGFTIKFPQKEQMSIYDASLEYLKDEIALIVLAGKEYGTGSSRDWAAKGALLLGVKAVIAESYERIHRSNLVGMGVLPLQFLPGENSESLGLMGSETYTIEGKLDANHPGSQYSVKAISEDGKQIEFNVFSRLDTSLEVKYYQQGGILNKILNDIVG
ncbi:MAG: aconitate hydratase AcnA [Anaerolineaceae bacterium]|nr:aconitate hydratase AcnA [Anaerolineaceae bacterium]